MFLQNGSNAGVVAAVVASYEVTEFWYNPFYQDRCYSLSYIFAGMSSSHTPHSYQVAAIDEIFVQVMYNHSNKREPLGEVHRSKLT